jgi:hypothetical protein
MTHTFLSAFLFKQLSGFPEGIVALPLLFVPFSKMKFGGPGFDCRPADFETGSRR